MLLEPGLLGGGSDESLLLAYAGYPVCVLHRNKTPKSRMQEARDTIGLRIHDEPHRQTPSRPAMTTERRYNESEIAAIFRQAAEAQETARRRASNSEGLTLEEIKQIGQEAGITPDFIVHAAAAVDRHVETRPLEKLVGIPVGVERAAELPGSFEDADWDRLVLDLQQTFRATGKTHADGAIRQWRNGNLKAVVGPGNEGHRLHLRTRKGEADTYIWGGFAALIIGIFVILSPMISGGGWSIDDAFGGMIVTLVGLGLLGHSAYRLPRWANERAEQMEDIIARSFDRTIARETSRLQEREAAMNPLEPSQPAPERVRMDIDASDAPQTGSDASKQRRSRERG